MIERIKTVERLAEYAPLLVKEYHEYRRLFEQDTTQEVFISKLFSYFTDKSNLFFGRINNGKLDFFVCATALPCKYKNVKLVWFLYCNPKCHKYTYEWLDLCKAYCRMEKVDELRFMTNRLTRSYRRFAARIKAKPTWLTYSINLNEEK